MSNFLKLTDELFARITTSDLAEAAGVSDNTIRQARMTEGTQGRRPPPAGWETAALKLAERQAAHFTRLATKLRG